MGRPTGSKNKATVKRKKKYLVIPVKGSGTSEEVEKILNSYAKTGHRLVAIWREGALIFERE